MTLDITADIAINPVWRPLHSFSWISCRIGSKTRLDALSFRRKLWAKDERRPLGESRPFKDVRVLTDGIEQPQQGIFWLIRVILVDDIELQIRDRQPG